MPIDLSQFETQDLMIEIQRRLDCLKKPEKRVVLIGTVWNVSMLMIWPCWNFLCA